MKGKLKTKKGKIVVGVILVIAVVVILIGTAMSRMQKQVELIANTVEVETVSRRDLSDSISLSGTAEGISKTNVISKAVAEVTAVNVNVGDVVEAGEVLCTLDSTDIEEKIAETKKSVTNESALAGNTSKQNAQALADAKADQTTQLAAANQQITDAQTDYNTANAKLAEDKKSLETRQAELSTAEAASRSAKEAADQDPKDTKLQSAYTAAAADYESKKAAVDALQSAISEQEASLTTLARAITASQSAYNTAKNETDKAITAAQNTVDMEKYQNTDSTTAETLKTLEAQLADCEVIAPCGGVITALNVSVGDNNTAEKPLLSIEDTGSMKINATVDEDDILRIEEGMKAIVTTTATGDKEIEGSVTRVVRVGTPSTNSSENGDASRTSGFAAEITIPQSEILVGMNAKVKVVIQEKKDVLAVPYDLIRTDADGNTYVLTAKPDKDGTCIATRVNVQAGEEVNYYTEITGGDLQEGDQLIYDGTTTVEEGAVFTPSQLYSKDLAGGATEAEVEVEQ